MRYLLCGATGFVGQALVSHFLFAGIDITVVGRSKDKIQKIFSEKVNSLSWEELTVEVLKKTDLIINLTGENISASRWTAELKQKILDSRVKSVQKLIALCLACKENLPRLFNASAIGIYGLQETSFQLPPALTESTPLHEPQDFLSKVGQAWENAALPAKEAGLPVTFLRFAPILDWRGGLLKKLALPYRWGLGGVLGSGQQAFSWVSLKDVIRAVDFLIEHPQLTGPFNVVAPHCVTQRQFSKFLAKTLHRPAFLKMPAWCVQLLFGQMGKELLLQGQHVYPKRLLEAGFTFAEPDLATALSTKHS